MPGAGLALRCAVVPAGTWASPVPIISTSASKVATPVVVSVPPTDRFPPTTALPDTSSEAKLPSDWEPGGKSSHAPCVLPVGTMTVALSSGAVLEASYQKRPCDPSPSDAPPST